MINPNDINNKIASANKQFEAMVCGRPIICTKETRSGDITEKEKCGLVINYSKDSLRGGIIKLRDDNDLCKKLGENALKTALNKYNWGIEKSKLLKLYKKPLFSFIKNLPPSVSVEIIALPLAIASKIVIPKASHSEGKINTFDESNICNLLFSNFVNRPGDPCLQAGTAPRGGNNNIFGYNILKEE